MDSGSSLPTEDSDNLFTPPSNLSISNQRNSEILSQRDLQYFYFRKLRKGAQIQY